MNIFGEEHPSVWAIELGKVNLGTGLSTVGHLVPEGTPGSSEFKPLRHKQKLHDDIGYYVSRDGRILSIKGNRKPKISSPSRRSKCVDKSTDGSKYIKPGNLNLSVPMGYYEDYEYTASTTFKYGKKYVSKNKTKPNVRFHKVAIETWKPFEEWCHEQELFYYDRFLISDSGDNITDMCLMSMCQYQIMANSTYSWWGAWLSNSENVIAPNLWFGPDGQDPKDIYVKRWRYLDV